MLVKYKKVGLGWLEEQVQKWEEENASEESSEDEGFAEKAFDPVGKDMEMVM